MKAFEEVSGARMYQGYGLTEAGPIISATPVEGDPNYESSGLPYPDTDVKIMDLQLGEIEMPPNKDGEIIVRGPQLMKTYLDNEEETNEALREGWLYTGDIGRMDENGYLYIVGRKKDRIIANGRIVWPTRVEETLTGHPDVEHAVAFGVPDPLRCSTDIRAMVVLREGKTGSEKLVKELLDLCVDQLEEHMVPTRITFRESVPLTIMGKVDRKKIIAEIDARINEIMQGGEIPEEYR
jgi:long-chain acyl-CoA synthetase